MAQNAKVVRQGLDPATGATTDFTSTGFGTPTAAIIIVGNANTVNNPQDHNSLSIGFWDGTNQRVVCVGGSDNVNSTSAWRYSDDSYGATVLSNGYGVSFSVSAVTDGIRLTAGTSALTASRYCTVLLLSGVSAKVGTFTPNATNNATQASASLGFAPKLVLFATVGVTTADVNTTPSVLSFGLARASDLAHRSVFWYSQTGVGTEDLNVLFSTTRIGGQLAGGTLTWSGEITTFGADTFTMTTRDGATGSDVGFYLALGGADLTIDMGTLTSLTSTGDDVVSTTNPSALLLMMSGGSSTSVETDARANGLCIGLADANGQFSHNQYVQDGATTTNCGSVAKSSQVLDYDSSSAGSRTDLLDATVAFNSGNFTLSYSAVDAVTARKGWWLAFGTAAAGGGGGSIIGDGNLLDGARLFNGRIAV